MATVASWGRRRRRATELASRAGPASDILTLYRHILACQEAVATRADRWRSVLPASLSPRGEPFRIDLAAVETLLPDQAFLEFIATVSEPATTVLRAVADQLREMPDTADRVLHRFLRREQLGALAGEVGCDSLALEFFPRAFMQPVVEVVRAQRTGPEGRADLQPGSRTADVTCPWCGWRPQVSLLEDQGEVRGRRRMICGLCAGEWDYPRSTCPSCGETSASKLSHHVTDQFPHLRVDSCEGCGVYVKTVDLRVDGTAVPLVDDVASLELDLWAVEQGWKKLQPNLMGL